MTDDTSAAVISYVRRARLVSAADIARTLSLPRSQVNSILYRNVGRVLLQSEEQPPRWSVLPAFVEPPTPRQSVEKLQIEPNIDFHVDFAGGDWKVRIVLGTDGSKNDPIARVEYLGKRHRLITVAPYACSPASGGVLPDAAVAIASSVLAWEIYQDLSTRGVSTFPFDEAIRDIFLSLSWQSKPATQARAAATDT